ncbi:MAG TPA: hypothetical protein VMV61_01560 [Patescibacteria group bacterium]|nr:hypothetical protein [Patescibacteria group bacterium]
MGVTRRNIVALVALVATFALAFPVLAHPDRASVILSQTCQVGKSTLSPGNYKLEINGDKVTFLQKGRVVAEATGEWKKTPGVADNSSVTLNAEGRVIEIRIGGRDSYFAVS